WKRTAGKVFMKVYWDPTKGERIKAYLHPQTGEVVPDEEIEAARAQGFDPDKVLQTVEFNLGDICIEIMPFDRVLIDPQAETLEEAEWVVFESVRTVEWIKEVYGVDVPP